MSTSTASAAPAATRLVQAVIVRCDGDQRTSGLPPWSSTTIPADHPVFWGTTPPLASRLEIPIAIHCEGTQSTERADLDNQFVTYLNIDPVTGMAPIPWQAGTIGTVVIARKDRRPFLPQHFEALWEYALEILDKFGDRDGPPLSMYNWQAFERWWKNRKLDAAAGREGQGKPGGALDPDDDWTDVKSPYEV
ncbi:uncharacterized protein B0H64DRAFT_207227 [Chaetomium fimeti]|uniref:Uncharacterized protein n=1 Tax=Chaetomium fimeti TaxID=1854472 RepID=A0AAE0HAY7_9PEZI|nr:hypothetical protein B0H64DRAFT_207227 [Chaetomium fimeti]